MDYLLFSEVAQTLHQITSRSLTEQTPLEKWTAGAEGGTQWHPGSQHEGPVIPGAWGPPHAWPACARAETLKGRLPPGTASSFYRRTL